MTIITFTVAGELYGVELPTVDSVSRSEGEGSDGAAPLLDLPARVGGEPAAAGAPEVRLRAGGREARLRVDRLGEVCEVDGADVREVPHLLASPLLRGVATLGDRLVILLNGEAVVAEAHAGTAEG